MGHYQDEQMRKAEENLGQEIYDLVKALGDEAESMDFTDYDARVKFIDCVDEIKHKVKHFESLVWEDMHSGSGY